jgi:hypothetical protein
LDESFGDDVHYEFYERLFTPEAVAAVCSAIGISMHPPSLERRRDEAPAEVYRRVAVRFPDVDLGAIWPSARHVL